MTKEKDLLYIKTISILILFFIFMSGIFAIDIGISAMMFELGSGIKTETQGLMFIRSPNAQYHLGLLISAVSFLIVSFLYLFEVTINNK